MTHMIQIDGEMREATDEEIAAIEAVQTEAAQRETDRIAKEEARASALAKLGLTADEIAALFG
mgnify:CR=1 FL=1